MARISKQNTEQTAEQLPPVEVDVDGLVSIASPELGDADDVEWVELATGVVVEGTIERAFFVTAPGEAPRVAYTIMDPDGNRWNVGEKHALKCMRDLRIGQFVRIDVKEKADIGKKRTVWRIDVRARPTQTGAIVLDVLKKLHKTLDATPF